MWWLAFQGCCVRPVGEKHTKSTFYSLFENSISQLSLFSTLFHIFSPTLPLYARYSWRGAWAQRGAARVAAGVVHSALRYVSALDATAVRGPLRGPSQQLVKLLLYFFLPVGFFFSTPKAPEW